MGATETHGGVGRTGAWIGVDLDGVLAHYPHNFPEIGPPIAPMVTRVRQWIAEGQDVRIFTARVAHVPGLRNGDGVEQDAAFADDQYQKIVTWCQIHLDAVLPVTATKDFKMVTLYDDRCVQMLTNTGRTVIDGVLDNLETMLAVVHASNRRLPVPD